ncbi:MAG: rhamnogalacturonan lyase [Planctomycetaceae bacterium]|nr:rhamnogalacturonan lyase [Planctomycetaceae bacterium]
MKRNGNGFSGALSFLIAAILIDSAALGAPRQMENLARGTLAVQQPAGQCYVGWRLLATEPDSIAFNVYRISSDGTRRKVNKDPITDSTNYLDTGLDPNESPSYIIAPVLNGKELPPEKPVKAWAADYIEIPIKPIFNYRPGDASVGDLDGDGEYEIILHQVSRGRDNSFAGITGTAVLDAYKLDGTLLWRIDLGINIREGEHYTQFMVYDLDGDGKAEIACKTADGTIDGAGKSIGDKDKDWRTQREGDSRNGRILEGPEYFTIFDGPTGAALKTVNYIPTRDPIDGWGGIGGNGGNDSYGNRCDRFLACVAYLDGQRPSVVMCRGVYGRTVMAAWDWRDGNLTSRWVFDSGISYPPFKDASPYSGMGGHSISAADVDSDGKDEIVYHSMVVDDNGKGLYSTGFRHGDALHVADMYPDRPGLEILTVHENEEETVRFQTPGVVMREAATGKVLWKHSISEDISDGIAADIDPTRYGFEAWDGSGMLRDSAGQIIGKCPRSRDFVIWWDGDLLRELLAGNSITKWNWKQGVEEQIFTAAGSGRRWFRPQLVADLLGDWREELLVTGPDRQSLRLYTTTIPTPHRIYTLMHDPQYRLSIAWQNVAYNKPAHTSFYLGDKMPPAPKPDIAAASQKR